MIYDWDQQLDEVNNYIPLPENLPSRLLYCTIKTQHLELGIKGNPPYLSVCAPDPSMITSFCLSCIAYVAVKALDWLPLLNIILGLILTRISEASLFRMSGIKELSSTRL